jgi:hypothetical protein
VKRWTNTVGQGAKQKIKKSSSMFKNKVISLVVKNKQILELEENNKIRNKLKMAVQILGKQSHIKT